MNDKVRVAKSCYTKLLYLHPGKTPSFSLRREIKFVAQANKRVMMSQIDVFLKQIYVAENSIPLEGIFCYSLVDPKTNMDE